MLKRYHLLILGVIFLIGCAPLVHRAPPSQQLPDAGQRITQSRPVGTFSQINAKGRINLTIHTDYKEPRVILTGDSRDLVGVKVVVNGSTLYLEVGNGYPRFGSIHADIRTQSINTLRYTGAGTIKGTQLHTRYLELYLENQGTTELAGSIGLQKLEVVGKGLVQIQGITSYDLNVHLIGNPKVQLQGSATLSDLNIDGSGWLSFYWVHSNHLKIRATRASKIQLAGIVNRLEVDLFGTARFKGRFLRAQRSFVRTHDRAVAEISSIHHQSSLATGASDIYYYNIPTFRADFMAYNGSVLNMREWSMFDTQNFNRYNKQFP